VMSLDDWLVTWLEKTLDGTFHKVEILVLLVLRILYCFFDSHHTSLVLQLYQMEKHIAPTNFRDKQVQDHLYRNHKHYIPYNQPTVLDKVQ